MVSDSNRHKNRLFLCGIGFVLLSIGAISVVLFLVVLLDAFGLLPVSVDLDGNSHLNTLLKSALFGVIAISVGMMLVKSGRKLPKIPADGQGG